MDVRLALDILPQPDDRTCGPTCLDAIYRYYDDPLPLEQVVEEVPQLDEGGTLAVHLACHALRRGYWATIYTYNLQLFDPTWFQSPGAELPAKLRAQLEFKRTPRREFATTAYLEFVERGGRLRFEDLTTALIRKYLTRSIPILTGLSATYLYHEAREFGPDNVADDVRGDPAGHFVVLTGYDREAREVHVADPLQDNPLHRSTNYAVNIDRLVGAILLGMITYDANLLVIEPPRGSPRWQRFARKSVDGHGSHPLPARAGDRPGPRRWPPGTEPH